MLKVHASVASDSVDYQSLLKKYMHFAAAPAQASSSGAIPTAQRPPKSLCLYSVLLKKKKSASASQQTLSMLRKAPLPKLHAPRIDRAAEASSRNFVKQHTLLSGPQSPLQINSPTLSI